jgi:4-amino-4-deoxy-L-arabinose transferase-like glycosyltransferase
MNRSTRALFIVVLAAFVARATLRLVGGEIDYLHNGYTLYLTIARTFLSGHGLCLQAGAGCARRMPVYSLLIAPFVASGAIFPWLPLVQAAAGAATVAIAWAIGRELGGERTALIAAVLTAGNPYAVVHDTALQETAVFNLLVALAVWLLLRLRRSATPAGALGAGVALGLAVLTTGRLLLFLPGAIVWAAWAADGQLLARARTACIVALPIALLIGAWALHNDATVGAPVLSTETGKNLWVGNNEWTFAAFPEKSIDRSQEQSFARLSPERRRALAASKGEVARDALERSWAVEFARAHPLAVLAAGLRKVWSAVSAELSPARGFWYSAGYRLFFLPVHILAAIGLWQLRGDRQGAALLAWLQISFLLTTAVFWSHTSHKSYLDAILFACAAVVADRWSRSAATDSWRIFLPNRRRVRRMGP